MVFESGDGLMLLCTTDNFGVNVVDIKERSCPAAFALLSKKLSKRTLQFVRGNISQIPASPANMVAVYLFSSFNTRLEPILIHSYPSCKRFVSIVFPFKNLH